MIISPPFLPANNNLAEDAWIDSAMPLDLPNGAAPRGVFPVGQNLGWHGGLHLVAPMNGAAALPVRAIADGTVVYVRQPSPVTTVATEPLNYDPAMVGASRTDDGCVVIRHETEVGATGAGVATSVTFYSIYMHLATVTCANQVVAGVAQQRATPFLIQRKDQIGTAGQIYGQPNRIHFEIIFDDAALQSILGRTLTQPAAGADGTAAAHTLDLAATSDGRSDAVFGEIYFRLPVGTTFYAARPALNVTAPTAAATHTLTEEQIVGMKFAAGDGPQANRGDISYRTYQLDGTEIGAAIIETDGEYNLYTTANDISRAYPATGRPAPSAVYELLRFGRILDTVNETLTPADVPMWKDVNYAGGHGWVNLHATGIHVYSDADLPQWKGWQVVDSDTDADSRCDAARIRAILDQDGNGTITPAEATTRIGDADIRKKLSRFLCKMPTEWEAASIDTRWGWLKTSNPENPTPFDDTRDYQPFKAHVTALCFWQAANLGIPATHWHAHPIEFIRHFRKCGWHSSAEMSLIMPKYPVFVQVGTNWQASTQANYIATTAIIHGRVANYQNPMNRVFRKYLGGHWRRKAHFLAQCALETFRWQRMTELGLGATNPANPMTEFYAAFYGRGVMQLTWASNFRDYGTYKNIPNHAGNYADQRITQTSVHWTGDPSSAQSAQIQWHPRYDPNMVATNQSMACDSGGFYWVSKVINRAGDICINRSCDRGIDPAQVGAVNVLVNGGGNGYHERQGYARYLRFWLGDELTPISPEVLTTPRQQVTVRLERPA